MQRTPRFKKNATFRRPATATATAMAMAMAMAIAGALGACGGPADVKRERPPTAVTVVEVKQEAMPIEVTAVGTVVPVATASVQPRVQGQITSIAFKEGDRVQKGQVLFEIDASPYVAAVAQADAVVAKDTVQSENADADSARYQQLVAQKLVSPADAEQKASAAKAFRAQLAADKAALDNAKLNLAWTRVTSPVAGRTDKRLIDVGNLVQPNGPAVVVVRQLQPIDVQFPVPQDWLFEVQARAKDGVVSVVALIPNHPEVHEEGKLVFIGSTVDSSTGVVVCKAEFDNQDEKLWPGEYVNLRIHLGEKKDAIVVPATTVQTSQQGPFAFVVKDDGTAEMRPVVPGTTKDGRTLIESGLKAGEKVVVDGQLALVPGGKVVAK